MRYSGVFAFTLSHLPIDSPIDVVNRSEAHMPSSLRLLLVATASALFVSPLVGGAAQRTFVSTGGSDGNPCSLAQPCRSFASAIAQTDPGGELIVLDSGGYGAVAVTKAVSIVAPPGVYAGISVFSGDGVTVNAGASDTVVLRGLSINGQGGATGVNVLQAARVRVESCTISGLSGSGIVHAAGAAEVIALDSVVRDNGASGLRLAVSGRLVVDHTRSEHNGAYGLDVAPSVAITPAMATVSDSVFVGNAQSGVNVVAGVANSRAFIHIERSILSQNTGDGFSASTQASGAVAVVMLSRNAISRNFGAGASIAGTVAGTMTAHFSDNAIASNNNGGLHADGGAEVEASANAFASNAVTDMLQTNGATFITFGDNTGDARSGSFTTQAPF